MRDAERARSAELLSLADGIAVEVLEPGRAKGTWVGKGAGLDTSIVSMSYRGNGKRVELPNARAEPEAPMGNRQWVRMIERSERDITGDFLLINRDDREALAARKARLAALRRGH